MDKENNVVYVQTKNGIFKCYKSEQMHKPIYYPVESKTNGYIDYYDLIRILNIDDLYEQCKKQQEVIDKAIKYIDDLRDESAERQGFYNCFPDDLYIADINELLDILKEVSK